MITAPGEAKPTVLERFDGLERALHWITAVIVATLVATGAVLYLGDLSALVGRRDLIRNIHVAAGLSLPIPIFLALLCPAGRGLRRDLVRLNRWSADDRRWWRRTQRSHVQLGKFNPGQKLNAAFLGGALTVMLMSGSIMRFFSPFPDAWRTGATSVHDWFALGIGFSLIGHVSFATRDPIAMRAMRSGPVPEPWARSHWPRWHAEVTGVADVSSVTTAVEPAANNPEESGPAH
jgi:formate dehydrogenase subunit gamma